MLPLLLLYSRNSRTCKITPLYFVLEGNFPSTSPRGAYIWKSDLTEGFLRYRFGGPIFGVAYFRNFTVYFSDVSNSLINSSQNPLLLLRDKFTVCCQQLSCDCWALASDFSLFPIRLRCQIESYLATFKQIQSDIYIKIVYLTAFAKTWL